MQVILRQDIEKLGKSGDVVKVKDGYARNFLLPRGLAFEATTLNVKRVEKEKQTRILDLEKRKTDALAQAERLKGFSCTISAEASDDDSLYGSITVADIADVCHNEGLNFDKKNIILEEPIKKLGVYKATIKLHPEVTQEIKIWIVRK